MADAPKIAPKVVEPEVVVEPKVEDVVEDVVVVPEKVIVKNISKNTLYGVSGAIDPNMEGEISFADFCNLSPEYVKEV